MRKSIAEIDPTSQRPIPARLVYVRWEKADGTVGLIPATVVQGWRPSENEDESVSHARVDVVAFGNGRHGRSQHDDCPIVGAEPVLGLLLFDSLMKEERADDNLIYEDDGNGGKKAKEEIIPDVNPGTAGPFHGLRAWAEWPVIISTNARRPISTIPPDLVERLRKEKEKKTGETKTEEGGNVQTHG
jgi:hypothetical protein